MSRNLKQTIIAIAFLFIFTGLGTGLYFLFKPGSNEPIIPEDTIEALEVESTNYVVSGTNKIDVIAKIKNSNHDYAASTFLYQFVVRDSQDLSLGTRPGKSYILPGQSKSIIEIGIEVPINNISDIDFTLDIEAVVWKKAENVKDPGLVVQKKDFQSLSDKGIAGSASGYLKNTNYSGYRKVDLAVILYDTRGIIIGLGKTGLETVVAGDETRYFQVNWDKVFNTKVNTIEVEAYTNILDKDNIIEVKGGGKTEF